MIKIVQYGALGVGKTGQSIAAVPSLHTAYFVVASRSGLDVAYNAQLNPHRSASGQVLVPANVAETDPQRPLASLAQHCTQVAGYASQGLEWGIVDDLSTIVLRELARLVPDPARVTKDQFIGACRTIAATLRPALAPLFTSPLGVIITAHERKPSGSTPGGPKMPPMAMTQLCEDAGLVIRATQAMPKPGAVPLAAAATGPAMGPAAGAGGPVPAPINGASVAPALGPLSPSFVYACPGRADASWLTKDRYGVCGPEQPMDLRAIVQQALSNISSAVTTAG